MADSAEWAMDDVAGEEIDWRYQIPAWFGQSVTDLPDMIDKLKELQRTVIDVINKAQVLGVVVIVTNSVKGWVETTMKKWLPQLKKYILGHGARPPIAVYYGQQEYRPPPDANLRWRDPFEQILWKRAAMLNCLDQLDDHYRVAPGSTYGEGSTTLTNIISIGDSPAEIKAAFLTPMTYQHKVTCSDNKVRPQSAPHGRQPPGNPWIKGVKMWESPDLDQIIQQLEWQTRLLPQIVAARSHLDLGSNDLVKMLKTPTDRKSVV